MRAPQGHQATIALEGVKIQDGRLTLQARVTLELPLPEQDADRPKHLEAAIESGGQALKRRLFQQAIERADGELILARHHGKQGQGIICRGTTPFTFKTVFGTVKVRRRRIEHRADGSTEVPAATAWRTPRQVAVTAGLCDAVCDGLLIASARRTVARLDQRAGEEGLLAKTTVLEIVHEQGRGLRQQTHARAAAVLQRDPRAAAVLLPTGPAAGPAAGPAGPSDPAGPAGPSEPAAPAGPGDPAGPTAGRPAGHLVGFADGPPPPPAVERDRPRRVDPGTALVQLDEVKVHAQATTGRQQLLVYTAVVMTAGWSWHLATATVAELAYQVAALLAALEVHRGARSLLVLADGARWIRDRFEGLGLKDKAMIVCWYHLKKRCEQDLSRACRGRDHRRRVEAPVLDALWQGRVGEAIEALRSRAEEMKDVKALEELIGYLEARRAYLPDYEARRRAGLRIASNRVEKFNDWSVSVRCKHRGMEWTEAGVIGLASLEAARRKGELPQWRQRRTLPAWEPPPSDQVAA
jgi:hypothetical protein